MRRIFFTTWWILATAIVALAGQSTDWDSFYETYEGAILMHGTIGGKDATLELYLENHKEVKGFYFFPVTIVNDPTYDLSGTKNHLDFNLVATDSRHKQVGVFKGTLKGGTFSGQFQDVSGRTVPFSLVSDHVTTELQQQRQAALPARYVTVTGNNVRMRTAPVINDRNIVKNAKGKPIYCNKGDRLKFIGTTDDFYLVEYKGSSVYISKRFATLQ